MKTILVIEDDPSCLATCSLALETTGHRVFRAPDGATGVSLARQEPPDLVLCDIDLPSLSGWEVLRALREDSALANVQFVFMTGHTRAHTPRAGMERGADDFLEKPFTAAALLACVDARLRRAEVARRLGEKALGDLRATLHSNLPHELFTPLASIIGLVEVMRQDPHGVSPAENADLLDDVHAAAHRLHRTLRNYLFALELEAPSDTSPAHLPAIDTRRAASVIQEGAQTAARRHGREDDLRLDLSTRAPALRISLTNLPIIAEELVENACAYSAPGSPVRVELSADGVFTVADFGPGMTHEQLTRVDAFRQFDRKHREQQGLGLGLFLVRKLARRSGSDLEIESAPGAGVLARLRIPVAVPVPA